MKVLFISSAYPTDQTDPRGVFIHRLARALHSAGTEVTVLAPGSPSAPAYAERDGVTIQRAPYWIKRWQRLAVGLSGIVPNLRSRPWLIVQVPALIIALTWRALRIASGFDLVHAHWVYPAGIAGLIASRWHKLPLVITSLGGDLNLAQRSRALYALSASVGKAADACIGVSVALAEDFRAMGVPPERTTFIPLGVEKMDPGGAIDIENDPDYRWFRDFDGFRLVYVGSLIPRKSVHTLLEACEVLERQGRHVACALVGSGPTETELRSLVRTKALANVLFLGYQPPAVAQRWLTVADAFVMPSLSEGRPVAITEAMVNGIPVVATDIPGSRELVQHQRTGLLFPPGDIKSLVDSIESLILDEQLRLDMGRHAQSTVESEGLLVSDVAVRHLELYQRLVAKAGAKLA